MSATVDGFVAEAWSGFQAGAGAQHGVEDHEELAHAGGEREAHRALPDVFLGGIGQRSDSNRTASGPQYPPSAVLSRK